MGSPKWSLFMKLWPLLRLGKNLSNFFFVIFMIDIIIIYMNFRN